MDDFDENVNINAKSKHLVSDEPICRNISVFSAEKPKTKRILLDFQFQPIKLDLSDGSKSPAKKQPCKKCKNKNLSQVVG